MTVTRTSQFRHSLLPRSPQVRDRLEICMHNPGILAHGQCNPTILARMASVTLAYGVHTGPSPDSPFSHALVAGQQAPSLAGRLLLCEERRIEQRVRASCPCLVPCPRLGRAARVAAHALERRHRERECEHTRTLRSSTRTSTATTSSIMRRHWRVIGHTIM